MTKQTPPQTAVRLKREAEALRENLSKRKQQKQQRQEHRSGEEVVSKE